MFSDPELERMRRTALIYQIELYGALNKTAFTDAINDAMGTDHDRTQVTNFLNGREVRGKVSCGQPVIDTIKTFLSQRRYWPQIEKPDDFYPALAGFFGDSTELDEQFLERYVGVHLYYQASTRSRGKVATSKLEITPHPTDRRFLIAVETSRNAGEGFTERFEGIVFKTPMSAAILLTQVPDRGPKLLLPITWSTDKPIAEPWVAGRLLKTSVNGPTWHQCNWYFRRAKPDDNLDGEFLYEGQLPENVRQRIYHWPSVPEVPPEPMPSLRLVPKPLPGED